VLTLYKSRKISLITNFKFNKMKNYKYLIMLFAITAIAITSCKKDDDGAEKLVISSIEAKGTSFEDGSDITLDLNGATTAIGVAVNSIITITFDKDVDASSVNSTNILLSSNAGDVDATYNTSGAVVTVTPSSELLRGTTFTFSFSGLKATDGATLTATTRAFITEGRAPVVVPNEDAMIAYWGFDGTTDDALGSFNADNVVEITYGDDRFGQGNSTAGFDGDESIIEVPGADQLMAENDFTLSFWMKTNSTGHINENGDPASYFVLGLGAFFGFQFEIPADFGSCKLAASYILEDGSQDSEDLFFNGNGQDGMNGGWQGWDFVADLTGTGGVASLLQDKWVHIICTYNAAEKQGQMFINGELMKSQDFDLWPDGAPKRTVTGVSYRGNEADVEPILAFGFIKSIDSPMWADTPWGDYAKITSNHFKGDLDDVRIFNAPFSADDVRSLYDAEKP
jgi:Big-like domain-containing protein/concanavalin A-like lectin/glucanase superfamily protein